LPPFGSFERKLPAAFRGEPVKSRFAIVVGLAVFGENEPLFQQALQRRVKRAVSHLENFFGPVFDGLRNGVSVGATRGEGLQNEQIESALKKIQVAIRLLVECRPIE
jgi:hypothetical protein